MEALIHLDTHVVAWLWAGDRARLRPVWRRLSSCELVISPMVAVELQYLYEIGRTASPGQEIVADLVDRIGLRLGTASFADVAAAASRITWARDPFDRLIVGQAMTESAPLLTRDRVIRSRFSGAIWGATR